MKKNLLYRCPCCGNEYESSQSPELVRAILRHGKKARLAEAAPQLLKACQAAEVTLGTLKRVCDEREWREDWPNFAKTFRQLSKAIAKATSRPV